MMNAQKTFSIFVVLCTSSLSHASVQPYIYKEQSNWWLAQLKRVSSLRSTKTRPTTDITVALPFSLDRFEALTLFCTTSWSGTVAAAVYLPLWDAQLYMPNVSSSYHGLSLPDALSKLEAFWEDLSKKGGCALDMEVYAEDLMELSDWYTYPVNSMRNRALAMVQTEAVILLDADFLIGPPSWGQKLISSQQEYDTLMQLLRGRAALVLPAFRDIDNPDYVSTEDSKAFVQKVIQADSKAFMVQQWDEGKLYIFMMPHHADTDYPKWRNATQRYHAPYGIMGRQSDGTPAYEPYVMVLKEGLPSYDERFRGFFKNKISYLWYLHVLGYQFHVEPDAFVIHYPHIKQNIPQQMHSPKHHELMRIWYEEMPVMMANGTYRPIVAQQAQPSRRSRARRKLPQLTDVV